MTPGSDALDSLDSSPHQAEHVVKPLLQRVPQSLRGVSQAATKTATTRGLKGLADGNVGGEKYTSILVVGFLQTS